MSSLCDEQGEFFCEGIKEESLIGVRDSKCIVLFGYRLSIVLCDYELGVAATDSIAPFHSVTLNAPVLTRSPASCSIV